MKMKRNQKVRAAHRSSFMEVGNVMSENTVFTPWAAAKVVNARLVEAGLTSKIPPQMMYNYTTGRLNAGKAPLIAYTTEGGMDREAFATWCDAYIAKKVAAARPADADPDQLELEFDTTGE